MESKRYLLDTHAFLWASVEPERLGAAAASVISDPRLTLYLSPASIWEILIKMSKGQIEPKRKDGVAYVQSLLRRFELLDVLPIRAEHVMEAYRLPAIHRDPFDRIMIGQARAEDLTFITADKAVREYDVETLWS